MRKLRFVLFILLFLPLWTHSQTITGSGFTLVVVNEHQQPVNAATVKLLRDGKVIIAKVAGEDGRARFEGFDKGTYRFLISSTGYQPKLTDAYPLPGQGQVSDTIRLQSLKNSLQKVTVTGHPPPVERRRDKTVVNVEASVTNTGSTVLEVLERSPGVTVDKNGGIALNGRQGVLVMIDDRPTYLGGDDLNNLLSSMNAAQVSRIELISNPSSKYDAAGSGGIINIRTKKNSTDGFNGSFTTSYGQGVYPKNNNSLGLNFRKGKLNAFFNYSFSVVEYLTNLYAYRKYYDDNNNVIAILEQPSYFTGTVTNNTVKTGLDYAIAPGTTIGMVLSGIAIQRKGNNASTGNWLQPDGAVDSSIFTRNRPVNMFRNGTINLNARHKLSKMADLSADLDYLTYPMEVKQDFENQLLKAGGYDDLFRSDIPTTIHIFSGKADATIKLDPDATLQAGFKSSSSHTDNAVTYQDWINQQWVIDETNSSHFVYRENIQAGYGSLEGNYHRFSYQAGLRYEYTTYTAHQFGNSQQQDSAVSRNYGSFFPNGYLSYKLDSLNSLTFKIGRRVDRPPFQSLNPFLYVINKYTYSTGNPYLLPQYSWNFELSHQYGKLLTLTLSYNNISNYFSQIFLSDTSKTILYYTQGNVGRVDDIGLLASLSLSPASWWSAELTAVCNHKEFKGFNGNNYRTKIFQLNVNLNNQLDFGNGYTGELSGFYTTRSRQDIQELLYPAGQVAAGIAKTVLRKKGTLKLSFRDILYTGAMEGFTSFPSATEYFKMKRDTRVISLAFTYRFGKFFKVSRHQGGAGEETERAPNG